jgi:hypothetical protein
LFRNEDPLFEEQGFIQVFLFTWILPFYLRSMRKTSLESKDFGDLSQGLEAKSTSFILKKSIEQERRRAKVDSKFRFWRVYWNFSKKRLFWAFMCAAISFIAEFIAFVSYNFSWIALTKSLASLNPGSYIINPLRLAY